MLKSMANMPAQCVINTKYLKSALTGATIAREEKSGIEKVQDLIQSMVDTIK